MKMKLLISGGRVGCPQRGDMDVESCFACPKLSYVRRSRSRSFVVCRGESALRPPDPSSVIRSL